MHRHSLATNLCQCSTFAIFMGERTHKLLVWLYQNWNISSPIYPMVRVSKYVSHLPKTCPFVHSDAANKSKIFVKTCANYLASLFYTGVPTPVLTACDEHGNNICTIQFASEIFRFDGPKVSPEQIHGLVYLSWFCTNAMPKSNCQVFWAGDTICLEHR